MKAQPAVGVVGIPFDANSSFRRGPARAPAAIRKALGSEAGNEYSERGVRVWPSDAVVDHGDLKVPQRARVRAPIDAIERGVARAAAVTPRLLMLGGDHAVSYPAVRAMAQRWGRLSILHFDAHPDMYPEYEGNRYSHASPMARILEEGLVDRLVQVGIRSPSPLQEAIARKYRVEVRRYDHARVSHAPRTLSDHVPFFVRSHAGKTYLFKPPFDELSPRLLFEWRGRYLADADQFIAGLIAGFFYDLKCLADSRRIQ